MQRANLTIAAAVCRSGRTFSAFLRSAPPAAAARRPLSDEAASTGDPYSTRRVALDFNEVRLVGRVAKVLDMNARFATFQLTTSYNRRKQSTTDEAETVVQMHDTHLVFGTGEQHGTSGGADWHLLVYPGNQVEVVGSLTYRTIRQSGADGEAEPADALQSPRFEPCIRMTRLTPVGGGDAAAQQQQQQRRQLEYRPQQERQRQPRSQQRQPWRRRDGNSDGDLDEGWGGPEYRSNWEQSKDGH